MATLTETEQTEVVFQRLQIATSSPSTSDAFTAAQMRIALNESYADLWEIEGGGFTRSTGGTLWSVQPSSGTLGVFTGLLATIREIKNLFASTSSGSTGAPASGDTEIEPADIARIQFQRLNETRFGSYNRPVLYALTRNATITPADINKFQLDVWPGVTGIYLPAWYVKQFSPLTGGADTTMDLTDVGTRDAALLTAARLAPLVGRAEYVPGIVSDFSLRNGEVLALKLRAMISADADK